MSEWQHQPREFRECHILGSFTNSVEASMHYHYTRIGEVFKMSENIFRYFLLHYIQQKMEKVHYSVPYLIYVGFCSKVQVTAIFFSLIFYF